MRVTWRGILAVMVLAGVSLAGAKSVAAQDDQFLMPEQSAAKAREILNQAVEALGGNAYLSVHDVTCTGRLGSFDHAGEMTGFEKFIDYTQPPFKERQENLPKRNIIQVFNGDKGWDLDRGGVTEAPQADLMQFKEEVLKDIDNVLRHRSHEPGMILRYGGPDVVDLKQADWVELVDSDNRTIRIAFAENTHLPIRKTVETRDPRTQRKSAEIEYYSNYHPIGGVQTPFQITRERNGIKTLQVFFDKCDFNTSVSDALFTKESLDQRWAQIPNRDKVRDKKDLDRQKEKEKDDKDSDKDSKN
ncbi:MAG: hypothetical protein P4L00_05175 [Candidatus Acidoferrales bacterium]|nr:hypothetical protein [Candidatus Acidoferrales bacterium]